MLVLYPPPALEIIAEKNGERIVQIIDKFNWKDRDVEDLNYFFPLLEGTYKLFIPGIYSNATTPHQNVRISWSAGEIYTVNVIANTTIREIDFNFSQVVP